MITIDAHSRDMVQGVVESKADKVDCFQWVCQLRSYWDSTINDCRIKICDASFPYGYEYLGNGARLVRACCAAHVGACTPLNRMRAHTRTYAHCSSYGSDDLLDRHLAFPSAMALPGSTDLIRASRHMCKCKHVCNTHAHTHTYMCKCKHVCNTHAHTRTCPPLLVTVGRHAPHGSHLHYSHPSMLAVPWHCPCRPCRCGKHAPAPAHKCTCTCRCGWAHKHAGAHTLLAEQPCKSEPVQQGVPAHPLFASAHWLQGRAARQTPCRM